MMMTKKRRSWQWWGRWRKRQSVEDKAIFDFGFSGITISTYVHSL